MKEANVYIYIYIYIYITYFLCIILQIYIYLINRLMHNRFDGYLHMKIQVYYNTIHAYYIYIIF